MHSADSHPPETELEKLDEQIASAKARYNKYEDLPTNSSIAIAKPPPVVALVGIAPAFVTYKLADFFDFSLIIRVVLIAAVYVIFTFSLQVYIRNKLRKNPKSKWRVFEQLY